MPGRPSHSPVTAVATSKEKNKGKGVQRAFDFLTAAGSPAPRAVWAAGGEKP